MTTTMRVSMLASVALLAVAAGAPAQAQQANSMTFFVTSDGPGKGADLGGLAGADAHCGKLAQAAGSHRQDLARLSQHPRRRRRERARPHRQGSLAERQGRRGRQERRRSAQRRNNLTKQTKLSEKGEVINGRSEKPNRHDILTGSTADGRAFPAGEDRTCKNWTSSTSGLRHARSSRPRGPARRRAVEVVELLASVARPGRRLHPGRSQEHRRRRPAVLLRGELNAARSHASDDAASDGYGRAESPAMSFRAVPASASSAATRARAGTGRSRRRSPSRR